MKTTTNGLWNFIQYHLLLYGCVSQRLGTTEFTNLIGWNRYWERSRFSHLDRHLDRKCFEVKKLPTRTKIQKYWLLSIKNFYLWKCQKAWWEKKHRGQANICRINFSSSPFASKMSACTNQLHQLSCSCLPYNKQLINRALSVCMEESWPRSCVQTSVKILPYRPPARLVRAN